ncbi:MAG: cytochrome c-type biogenesis protein CcmH [Actinomycetota bacterium]
MTGRRRTIAWVAIVAAALSLLVVATVDQGGVETDAERVQRLQGSFACPECRGESVADSNAAVAANIRQFIAAEVSEGSTDLEIRNELLRAYDAQVLLNPPADGLAALLWVLPVVIATAGAATVAGVITRRTPDAALTSADRELVAAARAASANGDGISNGNGTSNGTGNGDGTAAADRGSTR